MSEALFRFEVCRCGWRYLTTPGEGRCRECDAPVPNTPSSTGAEK